MHRPCQRPFAVRASGHAKAIRHTCRRQLGYFGGGRSLRNSPLSAARGRVLCRWRSFRLIFVGRRNRLLRLRAPILRNREIWKERKAAILRCGWPKAHEPTPRWQARHARNQSNLSAGFGLVRGGSSTALVGDLQTVAANERIYGARDRPLHSLASRNSSCRCFLLKARRAWYATGGNAGPFAEVVLPAPTSMAQS